MKKLMIAAAIVCAAAFANAASVNWMVGTITDAPTDGGWGEGVAGAGYTANISLYSDAAMTSLIWAGSSSVWEEGWVVEYTDDLFSYNPATTYYGKVICTTSVNGQLQTLESQGFEFTTNTLNPDPYITVGSTVDDIGGSIQQIGGAEFTGDHGAFSASGWTAAPEPTSGLLLLIGVAGLALRRRRA